MHEAYADIVDRIPEKPKWWTEDAVPRYCNFSPDYSSSIYADEVALLEVACQECGQRFMVEMLYTPTATRVRDTRLSSTLEYYLKDPTSWQWAPLHYGDPPRHDGEGCCAGHTMNVYDLRVVEFWKKNERFHWERVPKYEVAFPDAEEA